MVRKAITSITNSELLKVFAVVKGPARKSSSWSWLLVAVTGIHVKRERRHRIGESLSRNDNEPRSAHRASIVIANDSTSNRAGLLAPAGREGCVREILVERVLPRYCPRTNQ